MKPKFDDKIFDRNILNKDYSNFDHIHPGEEVEAKVRAGTHVIYHPAWDHHGTISHDGERFVERIKRYGAVVGYSTGETLKEAFEGANEQYGWD